jgi:D-alanyl-D-alanine carboxypeptidase
MDVGETLTVTEALYAMMVSSANEVSIALAEHIAGSVEEFVTLMNHRAVSLGAMNTNFVNPTGLPATGHVTTAYDMALIKREAVRLYPLYNKIIATRQFVIPPTERQPESRFLNTTNQMIRPGTAYFDGRVIGGKTGWTHAAGNTLVTYAVHEGRRLIVSILLGSGTTPYRETTALLDYAFDLPYEDRVVFHAASYIRTVPVYQNINGETTEIYRLSLKADKDLTYSLPVGFGLDRLSYELNVPTGLTAPVTEGDTIGNVAVSIQNIPLGTVALLAQTTVEPLPVSLPAEPIVDEPLYTTAPPEPVPYTQNSPTYNNFWDTLRNSEQLSALAVPITVSFFGLLFSIIIFAARRRRKMSKFFYIGSGGGKRYTTPYRYR